MRVAVTVGTDHHPFERLLDWVEAWAAERPDVELIVQHGASRPVPGARNHRLLPRDALLAVFRESDVVVAQGGPGSIIDARRCGRVPIVVARLARHGEVVDDHQVPFCDEMARLGMVRAAGSAAELAELLDLMRERPEDARCPEMTSPIEATAAEVRAALQDVAARGPGWVRPRRYRGFLRGLAGRRRGA